MATNGTSATTRAESAKAESARSGVKRRPGLEEQRKVIVLAAAELFSEVGTSASVADISRRAQLSRDTFYRCFADKPALIHHLYQTSVNDHIERVISSSALDYSNDAWLHEVFDKTIDAILLDHKVACFLFVESADPNSLAYEVIQGAYGKVARRMQAWCAANATEVPSREFFISLLVACQWLVHNAINAGMGAREVRKAKRASEQLFSAVFAGLKQAG